jgi:hypothetical protein
LGQVKLLQKKVAPLIDVFAVGIRRFLFVSLGYLTARNSIAAPVPFLAAMYDLDQ